MFSAGLGLDALALRSISALSLGEGGLNQETRHSVRVHIGCWPPVLQVAIVLELRSSGMHASAALVMLWSMHFCLICSDSDHRPPSPRS